MYNATESRIPQPAFVTAETPPAGRDSREALLSPEYHKGLLDYISARVSRAKQVRNNRIRRMALIDQAISTWQRLSGEDSERMRMEERDGTPQAILSTLPVLASHIDSTVAFFAEVFAPESRSVFTVPEKIKDVEGVTELARRLNRDTAYSAYYPVLARTLRALLKYNVGGIHVEWKPGSDTAEPRNSYAHVDMYNVMWDTAVNHPARVAREAEWVCLLSAISTKELLNRVQHQDYDHQAVYAAIQARENSHTKYHLQASLGSTEYLYVSPPNETQLSTTGRDTGSRTNGTNPNEMLDWYFTGTDGDTQGTIRGLEPGAHELKVVYIWLNPAEFGLVTTDGPARTSFTYELYRVDVVNAAHIVSVRSLVPPGLTEQDELIPVLLSYYTDDEMGQAQRSPAELLLPFQRFASYLMNSWILATRSAVFGTTYYDPAAFDIADLQAGMIGGFVKMRTANRDIRTAMFKDSGNAASTENIQMMHQVLELMRHFHPDQALPVQVAGIQRATTNQVSAVMNTAQSKLRLQARLIDADLLTSVRIQSYRNHVRSTDRTRLTGLTEEYVAQVLGSGLKTYDSERILLALREVLGFLQGVPAVAQAVKLPNLMTMFTMALNLPFDLGTIFPSPSELAAAQQQQQTPEVAPDSSGSDAVQSGLAPIA